VFETLGQAFGALGGVVLVPGRDGAGDREELGFDPCGEPTRAAAAQQASRRAIARSRRVIGSCSRRSRHSERLITEPMDRS
jgi:hypothetical protein